MRRVVVLWCVVFWCLGSMHGFANERLWNTSRRAFQDGLYDVASRQLQEWISQSPQHTTIPQARWLLGQAFYFQEEYDKALEIFSNPPTNLSAELQAGYLYWHGETLLALGKPEQAESIFREFVQKHLKDERLLLAQLGLASALHAQNNLEPALEILRELQASGTRSSVAQEAMLLRAKILIQQNQDQEAYQLLDNLSKENIRSRVLFESLYLQASIDHRSQRMDNALAKLRQITTDQRASPRSLVVQAWWLMAQIQQANSQWSSASQAYERVFSISKDSAKQLQAVEQFLNAQQKIGSLADGALKVRNLVSDQGESMSDALLLSAQAFEQAGNKDAAMLELDHLIKSYPQALSATRAQLRIAEMQAQSGRVEESIATLRKVAESQSTLAPQALLRIGELHFENKQYAQAAEVFNQLSQTEGNLPQLEQTMLNTALALLASEDYEAFQVTQQAFEKRFPQSTQGVAMELELARYWLRQAKPSEARATLEKILSKNTTASEPRAQALAMLASLLYQQAEHELGSQRFEQFTQEFPQHALVVQARIYRILSLWRTKTLKNDDAIKQLQELLDSTPGTLDKALITFHLGQMDYERQNFGGAVGYFQKFVNDFPQHELTHTALLLSARSLMAQAEHQQAIATLERIPTTSPLNVSARLGEVDAYRQLGNFEAALKVLDSPSLKEVEAGDLLIARAAVLYTLAGKDEKLYPRALEAAEAVLKSSVAHIAQRNEAGFIKAKTLEYMGQPEAALQAYLDVVYDKLLPSEGSMLPEYRWLMRCGVEAALMKEKRGDVRAALAIYRILERIGGPQRREFTQKIDDLRARHFIWEEN